MRLAGAHLALAACVFAITYVGTELTVGGKGSRGELTHDAVGKARWFFEQPLYRSLNVFDLTPSLWFAGLVVGLTSVGLVVWLVRHATRPLFLIAMALILVPLSYLPNLAVADLWPPYRTQGALSSLIALYVSLGALGLWLTLREWLQPRVGRRAVQAAQYAVVAISVAFVGTSVVLAAKHVETLIVEPQHTELGLLRGQVAALPTGAPRVAFVLTDPERGMVGELVYDEFGLPTTARPWAVGPSVALILREQGRGTLNQSPQAFLVYAPWATTFPPGVPVIDLRAPLLQLR